MRKRIWITGIILLAICCVLLFWHRAPERQKPEAQASAVAETQSSSEVSQHIAATATQNVSASKPPDFPKNLPIPRTAMEESNAVYQKIVAVWQAPIEFYGKIVDENSNPVVGAKVTFSWIETPEETGTRSSAAESDAEGLFSLHGARGPSLRVSVDKEGYYSSRKNPPGFKYGSFAIDDFSPDPRNPVIFHLWKKGKGEALINKDFPPGMQIAQLRHDGTPIEIDVLNGQKAAAGAGQLKLELWRDVSQKNAKIFDWKLDVSVPGGGLTKTEDEFAFEAPQEGYQPTLVIEMPATNQNWREEITSKYYIHLPDGKFGRIDFEFSSYNGVFTVHSVLNPSGSRNLEPSN
jgi:hypothetical protein